MAGNGMIGTAFAHPLRAVSWLGRLRPGPRGIAMTSALFHDCWAWIPDAEFTQVLGCRTGESRRDRAEIAAWLFHRRSGMSEHHMAETLR